MKIVVNSDDSLSKAIGRLRSEYKSSRYIQVTIKVGKQRSLQANALSHAWYQQISQELGEDSPEGVKRFCKLHYGVPILRAEEEEFREQYDRTIRGRFSYEEKLELMDWLPVTSLMTTKQMTRYLDAVRDAYSGIVKLEYPE